MDENLNKLRSNDPELRFETEVTQHHGPLSAWMVIWRATTILRVVPKLTLQAGRGAPSGTQCGKKMFVDWGICGSLNVNGLKFLPGPVANMENVHFLVSLDDVVDYTINMWPVAIKQMP
jgi:hypothetical protein